MSRIPSECFLAVAVAVASACSASTNSGDNDGARGPGDGAVVPGDGGAGRDVGVMTRGGNDGSATSDAAADTRAGYCMGAGPPVLVGDSDAGVPGGTCVASIAQRVFTNAVCSCTDAGVVGYFRTRSWRTPARWAVRW